MHGTSGALPSMLMVGRVVGTSVLFCLGKNVDVDGGWSSGEGDKLVGQ